MPCPRTHYLNNVPRLRGEKHDISLKILHQAGFETARQAGTLAERHALTIAPCPSLLNSILVVLYRYYPHNYLLTNENAQKICSVISKNNT